jgi:hypothetical protein
MPQSNMRVPLTTADVFCQWWPSYACTGCQAACGLLIAQNGTLSDGSGSSNYQSNANCEWMIAPPAASIIILSFSEMSTQAGIDVIRVFQCTQISCTQQELLAELSGLYSTPQTVTATSGYMKVVFTSDGSANYDGFNASWTSVRLFLAPSV